jgi:hypothetical protein
MLHENPLATSKAIEGTHTDIMIMTRLYGSWRWVNNDYVVFDRFLSARSNMLTATY